MENDRKPEIRITGVSKKINEELNNIADHKGVKRNQFLKLELSKIAESYPPHMKSPMEKV